MDDRAAFEARKAGLKKNVALRDAIHRLTSNRDFRKVIDQEYLVTNAARLVGQSADLTHTKEEREDALFLAQGAGILKNWLSITIRIGDMSAKELAEFEENAEEIEASFLEREAELENEEDEDQRTVDGRIEVDPS